MSAITLHLGRRFESGELHLHLPAAPDKIEEQLTMLDDYAEDLSKPVELRDVDCEIVGIRQYLRQADLSREDEINRLNTLAEKIAGMDVRQKNLLWGALDSESINSLDDVLRVADHLDQYELLRGIRNDGDLGAHLVEVGWKKFPADVLPYLDYAAIGLEYRSEHAGSFNGGGYVRKKDIDQQMEAGESKSPVFTVRLYAPGTNTPCSLSLPASDGMLDQALRTLGISEFAEADIHGIEDHIGLVCVEYAECPSVEDLNELARFASGHFATGKDWAKFAAVCEAARVNTCQGMLDIVRKLDDYQLYDASDPEEFGELLADEITGAGKDIMVEMEDFITYDYSGFALQKIKEYGIRETAYGYVRRISEPFPSLGFEQTMGQL